MRATSAVFLVLFAMLLAACSEPIPPEKIGYAGEWRSREMRLLITPEGHVEYQRREGSSSKSINAPIQRFEGDNFVVGIGVFNTTFVVSKPPYLDDGKWKMVVDGVELTRVNAFEGTRA